MVICHRASYHSNRWRSKEPKMPRRTFHQKTEPDRRAHGRQAGRCRLLRRMTVLVSQATRSGSGRAVESGYPDASHPMLGMLRAGPSEGLPVQQSISAFPMTLHTGFLCSRFPRSTSPCRPSRRAAGRPCLRGTPPPKPREGPGERWVTRLGDGQGDRGTRG